MGLHDWQAAQWAERRCHDMGLEARIATWGLRTEFRHGT